VNIKENNDNKGIRYGGLLLLGKNGSYEMAHEKGEEE